MVAPRRSTLFLHWHGRSVVLDRTRRDVSLGCIESSCLRVPGPFTSRSHATILRRALDYVLVDHSTNGTLVQTEDERVTFVRRGELHLWGEGWISLGEPLSPSSAIRFQLE